MSKPVLKNLHWGHSRPFRGAAIGPLELLSADLSKNRLVLDRGIVSEQEGFAQNESKHGVSLEWQRFSPY